MQGAAAAQTNKPAAIVSVEQPSQGPIQAPFKPQEQPAQ